MKENTKETIIGQIMVVLIIGIIAVLAFVVLPNAGWKAFEKSDIYDAFESYDNTNLTCQEEMEEPYVIVHNDMEKGKGITSWFQKWKVIGCSGLKTAKNFSKAKTIVVCESYFDTANYGSTGYSEYVKIYCVNAETGEIYTSKSGDYVIDEMEAKPFPSSVSNTPNYRYNDRKIKRYVRKHFSEW